MKHLSVLFLFVLITSVINSQALYTWELKLSGGGRGLPITIDHSKSKVYYGSSSTIHVSEDSGRTFSQIGTSIPQSSAVKNLILHPDRPDHIFVAVYKGSSYKVVKSTNMGKTWETKVDNLNFSFYGIPSTQHPTNPDVLYMMNGAAFMRSTDFGDTWETLSSNTGSNGAPCHLIAFPDTNIVLVGDNGGGIYRTTDGGLNWSRRYQTSGEIPTMAVDFSRPGVAWGTKFAGGGGVVRTTDYGDTWTSVGLSGINTWGVAINPDNSDYVLIGTWSGPTYLTRNNGTNWTSMSISPSNYGVAIIDSFSVFAAQSGGFYRLNTPNPPPIPVELTSFTANYENGNVILNWSTATETNNQGFEVLRSFKNNVWEKIAFINGNGTTTERKNYAFVDKNIANGKFNYKLKQIDFDGSFEYSNVVEVDVELPSKYSLNQNYPNPFNPVTNITFSIPTDANVKIEIFNVLGQKVTELVNGILKAGNHKLTFNAEGLNSGTYFYKLEATGKDGSNFVSTKKLTVIK